MKRDLQGAIWTIKKNLFSALNSTSINNTSSSEIALLLNTSRGQFLDYPFSPCISSHYTEMGMNLLWRNFMEFNRRLNF